MPAVRARAQPLAVLCLALALLLALSASAQAAQRVSYPALLHQIESGPLIRVIINRAGGDIEIKFRNLNEWKAPYPRAAQAHLQQILRARHIHVIFAAPPRHVARPRAVHHHLRYIADGVLGAILLVAAAWLLLRRRRPRAPLRGGPAPGGTGEQAIG